MFRTVFDGNPAIPRTLPLASGQAIKAGDLVTLVSGLVQAKGTATDFCGVAAEDGAGGTILVHCEPAQLFEVAVSGRDALATDLGAGFAPGGASGDQTLDLTASGNLRVVWLDPLALVQGSKVRVQIVDHQFSSNETDAERVPEPSTAGTWLRKVLAGVGSWVAGIPTITSPVSGDLVTQAADGTLGKAAVAPAALARRPSSVTAGNLLKADANKDPVDALVAPGALMLRPASATAGDVATMNSNKDAEGSGLPLSRVARRPVSATTGNLCVFDANDDPVDGGAVPVAVDPTILPFNDSNSADFNVSATGGIYVAAAVPNSITATLPATSAVVLGKVYTFKKMGPGANTLTIVPNADDLPTAGPADGIDGAASLVMTVDLSFVSLVCCRVKAGATVGAWQVVG